MSRPLSKLFPAVLAMVIPAIVGAEPPSHALQNIEWMTGCFEVTYRFAEDGEHDMFNPEVDVTGPVTEWIQLIQEDNGDLIFMHIGLAKGKSFPHFEETWSYREKAGLWRHEVLGRGGAMAPKKLRYACSGAWEGNVWECNAGRADRPLRDSGRDYEWLDRTNRLLVTTRGLGSQPAEQKDGRWETDKPITRLDRL